MPRGLIETPSTGRSADDARAVAERAGLIHRLDDRPGIRRRRVGRGFTYLDHHGRRLEGEARRQVEGLAVPPAWVDVWISPEPDSHLLASGVDDEGRKQYLYHPDWIATANAVKFERLADFAGPLSALRSHVERTLRNAGRNGEDDWICAAVVRLIDHSLIRPGSFRRLRDRGTVGAVTLHSGHVETTGRRVRLRFVGKGDVEHDLEVDDPLLARRISALLDRTDGDGPLFVDEAGATVDAPIVNRFIAEHAGPSYTAKDLRTWGATSLVADVLARARPGSVQDTYDADHESRIRRAIESASERLGNTAAVCRSSYVAPAIVEAYRTGALDDAWRRSRRATWLSRSEQTVRRVLTDH